VCDLWSFTVKFKKKQEMTNRVNTRGDHPRNRKFAATVLNTEW